MADNVLERIGVAVACETGIQMSPEAVRVGARVLLVHAMYRADGMGLGIERYAKEFLDIDISEKEPTDER